MTSLNCRGALFHGSRPSESRYCVMLVRSMTVFDVGRVTGSVINVASSGSG